MHTGLICGQLNPLLHMYGLGKERVRERESVPDLNLNTLCEYNEYHLVG